MNRNVAPSRRIQILGAARQAFSNHAYEDVSLRDVADLAVTDINQIVKEFRTKEELFAAALAAALNSPTTIEPERWSQTVAAELTGGTPADLIEPARIISLSAISPDVSRLILEETSNVIRKHQQHFGPGPDADVRASVATMFILGYTIISRWLLIPSELASELSIARSLAAKGLQLLRAPPAPTSGQPLSGSAATRAAILEAANIEFSRAGYSHATVRNIARLAAADPALVIRYFGSKENLLSSVLTSHYRPVVSDFPLRTLLDWFMFFGLEQSETRNGFLNIALRSIASPVARRLLADDFKRISFTPFDSYLTQPDATFRMNLIWGMYLGIGFSRSVLDLPILKHSRASIINYLRLVLFFLAKGETGSDSSGY